MFALVAVLLTTGWIALLMTAPVMPGWAGAMVYGFASLICHQISERSFHLLGFQLPVCARCLGIYAGMSCGAVYVWIRARTREGIVPIAPRTARRLAVLAAAPTLATVALETAGMWFPSNLTRAFAGLPLGGIVAFVVTSALATLHYDGCVPPRPTVPKPPHRSI